MSPFQDLLCACRYILGLELGCPGYPTNIGDAPSICREFLDGIIDLGSLEGEEVDADFPSIPLPFTIPFQTSSFSTLCSQPCFYSYLEVRYWVYVKILSFSASGGDQ